MDKFDQRTEKISVLASFSYYNKKFRQLINSKHELLKFEKHI